MTGAAGVRASAARGLPVLPAVPQVALVGNPNTGKTTLFNHLCGLRAKTANFPGTTTDARIGHALLPALEAGEEALAAQWVDLPGTYRIHVDLPEARICRDVLLGEGAYRRPDAVLVVIDATNLSRNLYLVGELLAIGVPTVVALNMVDIARRRGLSINADLLAEHLRCPVVPVVARRGVGVAELRRAVRQALASEEIASPATLPDPADSRGLAAWADRVFSESVGGAEALGAEGDSLTERLDQAFTHPLLGVVVFLLVMSGLFWTVFELASIPMDLIEASFGVVGGWVTATLPAGAIRDLLADGVIGGIAGTVVFLPQICILFFLLSLLEDTGYLARAAFVMDRFLCRFGLPGHAFVPLLSSHACALPGILSTKLIPDPRDRLATILVAPFMSCSARLPVYVLLTSLLFKDRPFYAGLAFTLCYLLGAGMALLSALLARRTFLRGASRPMVLELPSYKMPSLRSALYHAIHQGRAFLEKAGTVIVVICIVMWWLSAYPQSAPPPAAEELRHEAAVVEARAPEEAERLEQEAAFIEAKHAQAGSFAGRIGRTVQPVFAPLGFDWQLTVGVLTSFLAREVFVSTMAVLLVGDPESDVEDRGVLDKIRGATRDDGSPVFGVASSASLLVFFVLAMQCLPTLVVTRRESGSLKWAALQLVYMTSMAYLMAFATRHLLLALGFS